MALQSEGDRCRAERGTIESGRIRHGHRGLIAGVRTACVAASAALAFAACASHRPPIASISYDRAGCASLCPVDRLALDRNGRVRYDGFRNVPRLGHYVGLVDGATVSAAFAALDRSLAERTSPRGTDADSQRTSLTVRRSVADGSPDLARTVSISSEEASALDRIRDGTRFIAAAWEDPYLGYYARDGGPDTLDVLTIEDASPGMPIAYGRTTRVDPCVPRGLSDRAVSRGRLVRIGTNVRYAPERSEFDPVARPIGVRLIPGGLALRGDARERAFARLSEAAYLARLDRFQARVDARHGAPCATQ